MRQVLVHILGDYYFKTIPIEEAIRIHVIEEDIHSEQDVNGYCSKIINEKIPLKVTQWELHFYENYSPDESLIIWKSHHLLGDGISSTSALVGLSDEFIPDSLPTIRKVSFMEKLIMKTFAVLYMPAFILNSMTISDRKSPLNDKSPLTGIKNCVTSRDFSL